MKSLSFRLLTTTAIVLTCISGIVVLALAMLLRWGPDMLLNHELSRNAERIAEGARFNAAGLPDGVTESKDDDHVCGDSTRCRVSPTRPARRRAAGIGP